MGRKRPMEIWLNHFTLTGEATGHGIFSPSDTASCEAGRWHHRNGQPPDQRQKFTNTNGCFLKWRPLSILVLKLMVEDGPMVLGNHFKTSEMENLNQTSRISPAQSRAWFAHPAGWNECQARSNQTYLPEFPKQPWEWDRKLLVHLTG